VQCLYCGKGIGPIRQLRDLEFCSEAHRTLFRERYRRQLYEALAPEPAPQRLADFMEQTPAAAGPAPSAELRVLPKSLSGECPPAMPVAAGVSVDRPGWIFPASLAAMPTGLAWEDSIAAYPALIRTASFPIGIRPAEKPAAGAMPTLLVAGAVTARPLAAAPRLPEPRRALPDSVCLPDAARVAAPAKAQPLSPQLHPAAPVYGDPAAIGPVAPAIHAAVAPAWSATVAGPAAPAGPASTTQVNLAPAAMASQPRPLDAGPLPIDWTTVAYEAHGTRNIAIIRPKAPAECGQLQTTAALPRPSSQPSPAPAIAARPRQPFNPAVPLPQASRRPLALAPMAAARDPQPCALPAASPAWDANGKPRPLGAQALPQVPSIALPMGALAGSVERGVLEAAGNRNPRSAEPALAHIETPIARIEPSALPAVALPGEMAAAAPYQAEAPTPAPPPAAAPVWDATLALSQERPLVPLADATLAPIDCMPAPAGALAGPALPLRPDVGRSVRSCAVLWTLRVVRMCHPPFRMEPVRARFNDLVRSDRNLPYGADLEDVRPAKTNLRPFRRAPEARSGKPKWQYIAAAAAALLLAGILRPQVTPKGVGEGLPWHGMSIRQWMSQRATRDFADDFRAGLTQWKGVQPKWPKSWSYSTDGFIHPGQLALYRPSVPLSDYRFEFMAQVENKSVDWVVRAHDADNYYALKFTVLQPGPRPIMAMVRYPVIGGHKGERVETPLRMMIHANTPYRVTVDVKGNRYRAYIEGQEADFWTEDRLKTGGVGFFSEAGEHARVYWVKLESHGDILGRICGLLSGKSTQVATNDKENQAMDYRHAEVTDIKTAANTAQEARISRVLSKAASLHLDGKLDEGAKELVRALDGGERHPALYFALGQLQYEMQEYGPAAQSYAQAALLQPLHPTAHFNAGVCQGRIERWEEAAASFRKAISNDPARTDAHLALGACLVQLGLHNEALEAYDRFLERHPDHDEALFGKAVALQKRDRGSEAVELYKRILNRNPNSEEALGNLVSLTLANQDYELVRKYAQRLADTQPKSQIALEGLAGAAFAAGDHQAAADYSRKLAELAPQVFENWFNLGVACHKAGDLANASEAYARATRVQPDSPQAHLNLGVALQEQGDLKAARNAYQRALEIDPKLPGVHWNLGLAHEQLGDTQSAEKLYAQVPANSADSDDAAFRIGHLRLQRADYPGSIQAFEACLEKRPNWPEARLNLGIAHWRSGDKDKARACFQELTASGADSKEALRGLAALSLDNKDYDKAFEIYRQLLDAGERSPELLYNAGLICQRRGEPEDAAVLYREALKTDPGFGEALLNLGHALMSLGNEFEARSCWRKAVIAKPELAQRYFEPAALAS
jgi:tetratricopeptide (TPR) repeat protein